MDPNALAKMLMDRRVAREAYERARQSDDEARAQSARAAEREMQQAIMERLVPYFQALKSAAQGAFDCKAEAAPGSQDVSWLIFQFDRNQTFRIGRVGGSLSIERRTGAAPSGFTNIKEQVKTVIADASDLTDEKIGALLEELASFPPPIGLFWSFNTDLDGNPVD
jgi:hypothetical protein